VAIPATHLGHVGVCHWRPDTSEQCHWCGENVLKARQRVNDLVESFLWHCDLDVIMVAGCGLGEQI
jgi:hypothetical protein